MEKYLWLHQIIFFHVTKSKSTWHENISIIFNDVTWNMFQRFVLAPLNLLTHSHVHHLLFVVHMLTLLECTQGLLEKLYFVATLARPNNILAQMSLK
jgi:hypothetical protein